MRDFFSREYDFSFKDLLAMVFSGFFLFYAYKALTSEQALDLVGVLVPLIGIILGGYFGQEAIQAWKNAKPLKPERRKRVRVPIEDTYFDPRFDDVDNDRPRSTI